MNLGLFAALGAVSLIGMDFGRSPSMDVRALYRDGKLLGLSTSGGTVRHLPIVPPPPTKRQRRRQRGKAKGRTT